MENSAATTTAFNPVVAVLENSKPNEKTALIDLTNLNLG
jgi:hypothetical protein